MSRVIPPHLTKGSTRPPLVEGKLRLYSMEYCPFAQRVRLVLLAKKIPHDIVNINLIEKPEWYFDVNPKGLVPSIDAVSEIVVESLDASDWLDEKYPANPLYPKDPSTKQRDKKIIQKISNITTPFYKGLMKKDDVTAPETAKDLLPQLEVFEKELASRGSTFFGGQTPGMVDYMLWPFAERSKCLQYSYGTRIFQENQLPLLRQWKKAMLADPACSQTYNGPEKYWKLFQNRVQGLPVDYDNV